MNESQDKSLAWYLHPNEVVRMMRSKVIDAINPMIDVTPKYGQDVKIGVVITDDSDIPRIDLLLHYLKNVNKIDSILLYDSGRIENLSKLATAYNAEIYSSLKKYQAHAFRGDIHEQNAFYQGLKWAKENNVDVLVRFNGNLIPCYEWVSSLKQLILDSDGVTFSSYCPKCQFPIRVECIGMNVKAWTNDFTMNYLKFNIDNELVTFPEYWTDSMAKQIDGQNFSKKYRKWRDSHYVGQLRSGYVHWYDILGKCKLTKDDRHEGVLWIDYTTKEEYFNKINEIFPDKYRIEDLTKGDD